MCLQIQVPDGLISPAVLAVPHMFPVCAVQLQWQQLCVIELKGSFAGGMSNVWSKSQVHAWPLTLCVLTGGEGVIRTELFVLPAASILSGSSPRKVKVKAGRERRRQMWNGCSQEPKAQPS